MGRIQIGGQQGTTHKLRNVRVKTRYSCLEERITFKGCLDRRPGRERQQEKWVKDAPVMELLFDEYWSRVEDAVKVITRGWELITAEPCEAWMGDLILNRVAQTVEMSAKVETNNVVSTCGFIIDITPAFTTSATVAATESPVTSPTTQKITYSFDVSHYAGLNFYILPFVNDGTKIAYGIIKHIEIPLDI